ncbi:MAG: hypothetical protein ACK4VV_17090, partial [Pseudomonas sp.]
HNFSPTDKYCYPIDIKQNNWKSITGTKLDNSLGRTPLGEQPQHHIRAAFPSAHRITTGRSQS